MKKIIINLLTLLLVYTISYSQENFDTRPKTFPVAPNAYEFMKYGEIPVSKYTGVPNISIPIYTIEAGPGDLQIPISLTYHSNGFKVNEEAGWTGLGWTLNEGGTITQIVNGYDDFKSGSFYRNRELPDIDAMIFHASRGSAPRDAFTRTKKSYGYNLMVLKECLFRNPKTPAYYECPTISNYTGGSYFEVPEQFMSLRGGNVSPLFGTVGFYDFEPDVFSFSFLGYSGRFVLDWETETFKCLTDPKIKVEKDPNSHEKITITTPDGNIFLFSMKDETFYDRTNLKEPSPNIGATSRVYKLDRIFTNKGNSINYSYRKTRLVENFPLEYSTIVVDPASSNYSSISNDEPSKQTFTYVYKITFGDGLKSIHFYISDRLDFTGAKKLDKIIVRRNGSRNGGDKIVEKFNFNYSYFIGRNPTEPDLTFKNLKEYTHRLRLDNIEKTGGELYFFEYNNKQLPEKSSMKNRDYWGYYTSFNNRNAFPSLGRFNYKKEQFDDKFFNLGQGNNRSSRLEDTKAAILEKITYPTGGYTRFDFELNSFTNYIVPNFEDTVNTVYVLNRESFGAGLRVKRIENFDSNNRLTSKKTYSYLGGKLMTPLRFFNKVFINKYETISGSGDRSGYRVKISTSNFVTPSLNGIGNYVGYSEVTETIMSNKGDSKSIGQIKYKFENHNNKGVFVNTNVAEITNYSFRSQGKYAELSLPLHYANRPKNGSILEQLIFDDKANLKKKTVNTYSYKFNSYSTFGVRVGPYLEKGTVSGNWMDITFLGNTRSNLLGVYIIGGLHTFLDSTEEVNYFEGDSIYTKKEFEYNNYHQLKKEITTTSKGDVLESKIYYTSDLPLYVHDNFLTGIRATAVVKNNSKLISGLTNTYKHIEVPQHFPNSSSYDNYPWTNGVGQLHYITKIQDRVTGKFVEISRNKNGGIVSTWNLDNQFDNNLTTYVWGYNKTKIIAKIEHYQIPRDSWKGIKNTLDHPLIQAEKNAISSSNYDSYQETISSENALRIKFEELRQAFTNSMVTTYTYDRLVGVTSITDPRGETVYYEYDTFNRLKHVRDQDGNILSKNEYNYKN